MIATSLYLIRQMSGSLRIYACVSRRATDSYDVVDEVYTWILPRSMHEYFRRILPETGPVQFLLHPRDYAAIYTPAAKYTPARRETAMRDKWEKADFPVRFFIEKKAEGEFQMSIADPVRGGVLHLDPKDRKNWVWLPSKWSPYFEDLLQYHGAIEYRLSNLGAEQIALTEEKIMNGLLN